MSIKYYLIVVLKISFFKSTIWYITVMDLLILKPPWIIGVNPTLSWLKIFYVVLDIRSF